MDKRNKNILAVGVGSLIILLAHLFREFIGPLNFLSPFVLLFIIAGLNKPLYKINFTLAVVYGCGLLFLNSFLARYKGIHDQLGRFFVDSLFFLALAFAFAAMLSYACSTAKTSNEKKTLRIITNLLTVIISTTLTGLTYFFLFMNSSL